MLLLLRHVYSTWRNAYGHMIRPSDPTVVSPLPPSSHAKPVDTFGAAADLEAELRRVIRGEVAFDRGTRALYASDASNYRQPPIGVVVPRDNADVIATMAACRKFGAPVLSRGAGTSLAGQCCNVAVVLDYTKYMNQILEMNPGARYAWVQPGIVCDTLRDAAEVHRLTWGPDPSTHNRCSLGGMIGNNSCGTHSLLAGKTVDNIHELKVLLYDGTQFTVGPTSDAEFHAIIAEGGRRAQIYEALRSIRNRYSTLIRDKFPDIPRRVSGYNLDQLLPENGFNVARALVGTEGTCVAVLEAKARLVASPQFRSLVGLGYRDAFAAAEHVPEILALKPIGLEGFEGAMIDGLRRKGAPNLDLIPEGRGYLLAEFGSDDARTSEQLAHELMKRLSRLPEPPNMRLYTTAEAKAVWRIRESGPRAAGGGPGMPPRFEGWDDAAVSPEKLAPYLRELRALLNAFNYDAAYYGHFGDGCIHMQVSFDLFTEPGVRKYAEFIDRAADLVVKYGGSLSGEHGDGQARGSLLPKMYGPELMEAFREFKLIWDPDNKMNPHKAVVDPYPPTENLRLGADYKPQSPVTRFAFPDDQGSFAKASLRCIGVGACRKTGEGAMCPSYMATLDEEHSTRGRARLLWEMLQGEIVQGGWKEERIKQAMDLCLSCKACKSECPTNVDLATYRSEFLSHYYESRSRPLQAYAFGMIDRWARLAGTAPRLANFINRLPGVRPLIRSLLHLAPQRALPEFAPYNFQAWARTRVPDAAQIASPDDKARHVLLWPDTFNNYFHPETSKAAYEVLRDAGFQVSVPAGRFCCGRPLYDFGMIDRARSYLENIMAELAAPIDAGIPIVVLEPSCASVFRDELRNLFPSDQRAERLRRQTFLLSEFLQRHGSDYTPPKFSGTVLLHGHCHHKAIMKMTDEEALLKRMSAAVQQPDPGCCGMAGPFGFEAEKYRVSQAIGERALLPAVRAAANETLIVADGFSCREQIAQGTGRSAMHLADFLRLASRR
jgi:FAD/FMN-containing dehydrogenase/Fe-S oxidoreductase